MRFTDPPGEAIVIDGRHVWVYTPSTVPGQVIRLAVPSGGPVYGYNLLAWLLDRPAERYKASYLSSERLNGRTTDVIELVPGGPGSSVQKGGDLARSGERPAPPPRDPRAIWRHPNSQLDRIRVNQRCRSGPSPSRSRGCSGRRPVAATPASSGNSPARPRPPASPHLAQPCFTRQGDCCPSDRAIELLSSALERL